MTDTEQRLQMQLTAAQGALADVLRELREAHTIACGTDPANQTRPLIDLVQELRLAADITFALRAVVSQEPHS